MMMLAKALAIDPADLPFLAMLAIVLLISIAGAIGIVVTPWSRISPPDGLEDWRRK